MCHVLIASGLSQPLGPSASPAPSCSAGTLATVSVRSHMCTQVQKCHPWTESNNREEFAGFFLYSEGVQSQCSVFSYLTSSFPTLPSGDHVIRETVLCTCFFLHSVLGSSPILVNLVVFFAHVEYYPKVKLFKTVFRERSLPSLFPLSCSLYSS